MKLWQLLFPFSLFNFHQLLFVFYFILKAFRLLLLMIYSFFLLLISVFCSLQRFSLWIFLFIIYSVILCFIIFCYTIFSRHFTSQGSPQACIKWNNNQRKGGGELKQDIVVKFSPFGFDNFNLHSLQSIIDESLR